LVSPLKLHTRFVCRSVGGSYSPHEDKTLIDGMWYFGDGFNKDTHEGLYEFFCHSDCDGEMTPEICVMVANDLESILPNITELESKEEAHGHILRDGGYVEVTKRFIAGCRLANERNEPLEFQ
jgi:hypothetical protein